MRERGYSVALGGEGQQRLVQALQDAGHEPRGSRGGEEYALVELAGDSRYRINHIGAPVFDPRGEVSLALFLIGFRGQIAAEEAPRYADRPAGGRRRGQPAAARGPTRRVLTRDGSRNTHQRRRTPTQNPSVLALE